MKKLSYLENYNDHERNAEKALTDQAEKVKEVNELLKMYKTQWKSIIKVLDENEINHSTWNELDILYFYLKYQDELVDKFWKNTSEK